MKRVRTILIGMGTVNIGLLKLLSEKGKQIADEYGIIFVVVAVADSSGVAVNPEGFDHDQLISWKRAGKKVCAMKEFDPIRVERIASHVPADLLIESSAGNLLTGAPGLEIVRNALRHGVHVVLANKAPLVFAFDDLHRVARETNVGFAFSATVCGGLPVINVLRRDLKFATLKKLKGIFNATTNYILHQIEQGGSQEEAIREAQQIGAAEADPSYDVNGHDTANKLFIIMKCFAGFGGSITDIAVEGIQNVDRSQVMMAQASDNKIKLLATAEMKDDVWKLSVQPTVIPQHSFLGTCEKWEMGIEIETDLYESICMKNFEADPVGTSAAVLRDSIDLMLASGK
jgi:homoserine dehydrogenase